MFLENFNTLFASLTGFTIYDLVKALILVFVGYVIGKLASLGAKKTFLRFTPQYQSKLINRIIFYFVFILFVIAGLQHLGFRLNVLLGAAGILTVALGFASQTSVSNIISGLFVIAEKPFTIGDTIGLDGLTGEILSIDLLSIKIRTTQNTLVRIPNEVLIKSTVTNYTRFPIRRFDLKLGVAYGEDFNKIETILLSIANKNPLCLEEPKANVSISEFGNSTINILFSMWAAKENFAMLKDIIQQEIKIAFEQNNIDMPFPQLTLSTNQNSPFIIESSSQAQSQGK